MTVNDWESAMGTMRAAVIAVEDRLPPSDVDNVWELVEAGEPGVAFETLCTQLYEYDVAVPGPTLASLAELGRYFKFDPKLWEILTAET